MYLGDETSDANSWADNEKDTFQSQSLDMHDMKFDRSPSTDFVDLNESITSRQRTMFIQK